MRETTQQLYTTKLNNNCPECYDNTGLELSFFQSEKENMLYTQASGEITSEMQCHTCGTMVFPVRWDKDIERVFDYHKKRVNAKPSKIHLKPLAYGLIATDLLLLAFLLYYFLS
jgi:hypothetical protein